MGLKYLLPNLFGFNNQAYEPLELDKSKPQLNTDSLTGFILSTAS